MLFVEEVPGSGSSVHQPPMHDASMAAQKGRPFEASNGRTRQTGSSRRRSSTILPGAHHAVRLFSRSYTFHLRRREDTPQVSNDAIWMRMLTSTEKPLMSAGKHFMLPFGTQFCINPI